MLPTLIGLATTAAAAAASAAAYQSMAPSGQWYGQTFASGVRGSKQVALTYDDGPNDPHTLKLLEVLAKHSVRATFFMIGRYVQQRPDIARAVAQAGHVIGNHTFTHPLLIFESAAQTRSQLVDCRQALDDTVMWNVTGYDWNAPPAAMIAKKVARQMRGGDVILLHDGGHRAMGADREQTVIATENLIQRYKAEGYEFVTVGEMLAVGIGIAES